MMPLVPLKLPAGMHRVGTDYDSLNRWRDGNLVRFHNGTIGPVGGWTQHANVSASLTEVPRAVHAWVDNSFNPRLALATNSELIYIAPDRTVYDITPSDLVSANPEQNAAYGGGNYGEYLYGTARLDLPVNTYQSAMWSLDNWGEYLIGCSTSDGRLFEWQLDTLTPAASIANSPVDCKGVLVTQERFVMALQAGGNPRKVAWSDREDNTTWAAAVDNEAGDFELATHGEIMSARNMATGVLINTTVDAHVAVYQGAPYVYGFRKVGSACGAASRNSAVTTDKGAFWMGRESFFYFDGNTVSGLNCEVSDYIFEDLNSEEISKVYGLHNSEYGEVWWFYPSEGSSECDSYVVFDYIQNHWEFGRINRTCGVDQGVFSDPLWVDETGVIYFHELHGYSHGSYTPFIETGALTIGNGDQVAHVRGVITDEGTQGDVKMRFKTRFHPNDVEREYGDYIIDGHPTSLRVTGRQFRVRFEATNNNDFRIGTMRFDVVAGGGR